MNLNYYLIFLKFKAPVPIACNANSTMDTSTDTITVNGELVTVIDCSAAVPVGFELQENARKRTPKHMRGLSPKKRQGKRHVQNMFVEQSSNYREDISGPSYV